MCEADIRTWGLLLHALVSGFGCRLSCKSISPNIQTLSPWSRKPRQHLHEHLRPEPEAAKTSTTSETGGMFIMAPGWMESPGSVSWGTTTMEASVGFESCSAALRSCSLGVFCPQPLSARLPVQQGLGPAAPWLFADPRELEELRWKECELESSPGSGVFCGSLARFRWFGGLGPRADGCCHQVRLSLYGLGAWGCKGSRQS